jgi:mevalonate kinase
MPAISCSAPGKVILCGEHAVVYGKPAIAVPVLDVSTKVTIIPRPSAPSDETLIVAPNIGLKCHFGCLVETHPIRTTIRLVLEYLKIDHLPVCEILIHSTLPTAAGLGSSASTSVALIRAVSTFLGHPLDNSEVNQIAFEIEKIHHGSPSGIDNTVITYAKTLFFIKGQSNEFLVPSKTLTLVIGDSGIKSTTVKVVEEVKNHHDSDPAGYDELFSKIGSISLRVKAYLQTGNLPDIGMALTENHLLLQGMGISCSKLDRLIKSALDHGALGAKLSGGGQGGNMIALVIPEEAERIAACLKEAGAVNTIITHIPGLDKP